MVLDRHRIRWTLTAATAIISCFLWAGVYVRNKLAAASLSSGPPPLVTQKGLVLAGDSFGSAFKRAGVPAPLSQSLERAFAASFNLRAIQPGHRFEVATSTSGEFRQMVYRLDPITSYSLAPNGEAGYSISKETKKTVWIEKRVVGVVRENMYKDLLKQGYDNRFVANLVGDLADNIFGWQIDFFTEQRTGDRFDVLMEQEYVVGTGQPLRNGRGRILIAKYEGLATRQKVNMAFRYQAPGAKLANFYDGNGNAVQKVFLRAPFTHGIFRVSSRFSSRRFHPILRTYRAHHGIDYAAPHGTPVACIGGGRVVFAGWKGGFGNCVEIQHSPKYVSRYGHLSRIGVSLGQRLEQGKYVGSVGSTGLSTGPHLHFELLVDGQKTNFLRMNFPPAAAVAKDQKEDFGRVKNDLLARLNANDQLANATPPATDNN